MVILSSKPIAPNQLPSLPSPMSRGTKTDKPTDKLYITCLLRVPLLCKIYIL